ncbi:hypothetical protein QJQ45_010078 [Haematococcus lacustris]|nr:hypothetical protein QJQ45_010078 [Haematococcus lacustris]
MEAHKLAINQVVSRALEQAGLEPHQLSAVAVTVGPGLSLCLRVGVAKALELCTRHQLPLLPIHHMEAHALVARMMPNAAQRPPFPFLCLLVSGGHNLLVLVRGPGQYVQLGATVDDALGEAFDKTARLLGLEPRPSGGAALEALASQGNPTAFKFAVPMKKRTNCDFSYAGLKTSVRMAIEAHVGVAPFSLPSSTPLTQEQAAELVAAHPLAFQDIEAASAGLEADPTPHRALLRSVRGQLMMPPSPQTQQPEQQQRQHHHHQQQQQQQQQQEGSPDSSNSSSYEGQGSHGLTSPSDTASHDSSHVNSGGQLHPHSHLSSSSPSPHTSAPPPPTQPPPPANQPSALPKQLPSQPHAAANSAATQPSPPCAVSADKLRTKADIAASFQHVATLHLVERVRRAALWARTLEPGLTHLVVSGGVACNQHIRRSLTKLSEQERLQLVLPPSKWCTDNGVMVAWAGVERMALGLQESPPPIDSPPIDGDTWIELRPRWPLTSDIVSSDPAHLSPDPAIDASTRPAAYAAHSARRARMFTSLTEMTLLQLTGSPAVSVQPKAGEGKPQECHPVSVEVLRRCAEAGYGRLSRHGRPTGSMAEQLSPAGLAPSPSPTDIFIQTQEGPVGRPAARTAPYNAHHCLSTVRLHLETGVNRRALSKCRQFFVSEQCVLPNPHRPGKTSTVGRELHIVSTYMRRKTLGTTPELAVPAGAPPQQQQQLAAASTSRKREAPAANKPRAAKQGATHSIVAKRARAARLAWGEIARI